MTTNTTRRTASIRVVQDGCDRGTDELGGVVVDAVSDAWREALLELAQAAMYGVGGGDGVAAGELEDAEGDGVVAVHVGAGGVVARAELDAGDVAEADHIALVTGFEHDVAEFGRGS
jgi:hypothetical protein